MENEKLIYARIPLRVSKMYVYVHVSKAFLFFFREKNLNNIKTFYILLYVYTNIYFL